MSKQEIQHIIISYLKNYYPEKVGFFGSFARNENKPGSDIDLLVKFKNALSLLQIIKIENELSELLHTKVDLVTEGALKNKRIRDNVFEGLEIFYES